MTDPDLTLESVERCGNWIAHNASPTGINLWNDACDALDAELEAEKARAEAAEAKLKEAVDRMEEIAHMGYDMPSTFAGTEGEWYSRRANLMQGIARAFLATLDQST